METKEVIENIRKGTLDINNRELFFSILIKGLLLRLKDDINIRNIPVPHFILHTGDDTMYLMMKGQDMSVEPGSVSNENYIYNTIPRCIVTPEGIDLQASQLSSPHSKGMCQFEYENQIYTLVGEFRRIPIKLGVNLKYYVNSYTDYLELIQKIISKLAFIRNFSITYMGQEILSSYKIPENFSAEYMMTLDGTTTDNKNRIVDLGLEVETNYPVWAERTIMSTDKLCTPKLNINVKS